MTRWFICLGLICAACSPLEQQSAHFASLSVFGFGQSKILTVTDTDMVRVAQGETDADARSERSVSGAYDALRGAMGGVDSLGFDPQGKVSVQGCAYQVVVTDLEGRDFSGIATSDAARALFDKARAAVPRAGAFVHPQCLP